MGMVRCLVATAVYLALLAIPSHRPLKSLPLSDDSAARLLPVVTWMIPLWLICELNGLLNSWADNRWMFKSDQRSWDWKNEIAVVTGGSAGIGAMVVKKLLSHGIRVAVLDVQPLSDVFQQGLPSRCTLTCVAPAKILYRGEENGQFLPM